MDIGTSWGFQSFGEPPLHCWSLKGLGSLSVHIYRFGNWWQEKLWLNWIHFFLLRPTGLSACVKVYITCSYSTRKMFLRSSASPLLFSISLLCHVCVPDLEGKSTCNKKLYVWVLILIWNVTVGEHISRTALLEKCIWWIYSGFILSWPGWLSQWYSRLLPAVRSCTVLWGLWFDWRISCSGSTRLHRQYL